jgi:hypothetical protein
MAALIAACSGGSSIAPVVKHHTPTPTATPTVGLALWVANTGTPPDPNVPEFSPSQTTLPGISDPAPALNNTSGDFTSPQDPVFDASGNLWIVDGGNNVDISPAVFEFSAAQLAALGTTPNPVPVFAITNSGGVPGFVFPQFGLFNSAGDLYIADPGNDNIYYYKAAQLTGDGTGLAPTAVFQVTGSTAILGLAFDSVGDLFLADNGAASIYVIDAAHIPTTSVPSVDPDVTLSTNNATHFASIDGPWGLVFDSKGDLWFSNEGVILDSGPSVVEFAASVLTGSGTPAPLAQLTSTTLSNEDASIADPQGISFDNLGNLAIANDANSSIAIFAASQLVDGDSSPVPNVFIVGSTSTINAPTGLIFGPNVGGTTTAKARR